MEKALLFLAAFLVLSLNSVTDAARGLPVLFLPHITKKIDAMKGR